MRIKIRVRIVIYVMVGAALMLGLVSVAFAQTTTLAAVACPGAPVPRLNVGDIARPAQVFSSLRAGLGSAVVLKVMLKSVGDTFTILEGPTCSFGPHNWYKVNHNGTTGYVTEGEASTYWVEKVPAPAPTPTPIPPPQPKPGPCAGAPAPRLTANTLARPAQVYSSLRANLDSNVVLKVMLKSAGDTFTVLEGPFCGTGPHNWYKVNHGGTIGWVTEGIGSTYWVEPVPK
jgi:hypothetical protein